MKKNVTIEWGMNAPWNDDKTEARQVRTEYLESKVLAGLTPEVIGTRDTNFNRLSRAWLDQAAAEEEVAYVTEYAKTYGLDLISVEIWDAE